MSGVVSAAIMPLEESVGCNPMHVRLLLKRALDEMFEDSHSLLLASIVARDTTARSGGSLVIGPIENTE